MSDEKRLSLRVSLKKLPSLKEIAKRLSGQRDNLSNDIIQYRGISLNAVVALRDSIKAGDAASNTELEVICDEEHELAGRTLSVTKRCDGQLQGVVAYVDKPVLIRTTQATAKPRADWTTEDVCEYVVLPATLQQEAFFVDTLHAAADVGKPFQGAFVSHARQCRFDDLVSALERHFENRDARSVFLWLDLFSANQPKLANADADLSEAIRTKRIALLNGGLHAAIERFEERLLFCDKWEKPAPLTRMWCVWELYGAVRCNKPVSLVLGRGQEGRLVETVRLSHQDVSGSLARIEMREAFCHSNADRAMICDAVEALPGGFSMLNGIVLERLRAWLGEAIKKAVLRQENENDLQLLLCGGNVLGDLGDADGAERFYDRALKSAKAVFGKGHLTTAAAMASVGYVLLEKGDLEGAQRLFTEALAIKKKKLGAKDISTATTTANLARVLHAKGDLDAALRLFKEALDVMKRQREHRTPLTAVTMQSLATVLCDQGDFDGALQLFEQALDIEKEQLGDKHRRTARTMRNLADALHAKGDFESALRLCEQVLAIEKEQLGDKHESLGVTLCSTSLVRSSMQAFDDALSLAEESLDIFRGTQLDQASHMHFGSAFLAQGRALTGLGRTGEAEAALRRSLAIRERTCGPGHFETAVALAALAELLHDGDMARHALAIREKQLGHNHKKTQEARALVAALTQ